MSKNKTPTKPVKKIVRKKAVSKKTPASQKVVEKKSITKTEQVTKEVPLKTENKKVESCRIACSSKKVRFLIAAAVLIVIFIAVQLGKDSTKNSDGVKIDKNSTVSTVQDVENIVANWVETNPELILESVINMQKKQAQKQTEDAGKNIAKRTKDLYNVKDDPSISPVASDVSIIEFFDYNCGYCKRSLPVIEQLVAADVKVKVIFKELPILGKSSEDLAKVSIAVNMIDPNKYFAFHQDIMKSNAKTTDEAVAIAEKHGITSIQLTKVLTKFQSKIEDQIEFNRELATSIGVNGTPAFLVGENLMPGAVDVATLKQAIAALRNK